jgi:uncharacterized protein (TIGR04255 family)
MVRQTEKPWFMTDAQRSATPHFENPPVVETVLGVQFAPLKEMRVTHYGLLLVRLREAFPAPGERLTKISEQAPLDPVIEGFGAVRGRVPTVQWSIGPALAFPRCWYASEDDRYVVQVQPDRFIFNWRQQREPSGAYPRYQRVLAGFLKVFECFQRFAASESLGALQPNQCEVTYVNHVDLLNGRNVAETLDSLLVGWKLATSDGWLAGAERGGFVASYVIPERRGRLHVSAQPATRLDDEREIIRLELTARGAPSPQDIDGVRQWLDLGHEWVVRGFTSLTTPEMHKKWGRTQ